MKPDKSRVIRYDLETKEILQIFDSSKAASIYLDIKASNVSLCINVMVLEVISDILNAPLFFKLPASEQLAMITTSSTE